jgi:hypothetical protein
MTDTPTPWRLYKDSLERANHWGIRSANEMWVATIQMHAETPQESNAALIVECVNAHASLIAERDALRAALEIARANLQFLPPDDVVEQIDAALALRTERP